MASGGADRAVAYREVGEEYCNRRWMHDTGENEVRQAGAKHAGSGRGESEADPHRQSCRSPCEASKRHRSVTSCNENARVRALFDSSLVDALDAVLDLRARANGEEVSMLAGRGGRGRGSTKIEHFESMLRTEVSWSANTGGDRQ